MSITRLDISLKQILQLGSYAHCEVRSYEDDQQSDFWYFVIVDKVVQYPGTYVNLMGRISAQFLLDPVLKALSVQALFTCDNRHGQCDIVCHFVGHGKLHLPGIANSAGIKHGIIDIELSVKQFVATGLPTGNNGTTVGFYGSTPACPVVKDREAKTSGYLGACDCGGRKAGYKDDELHGHAHWCDLVTSARKGGVAHGNGD